MISGKDSQSEEVDIRRTLGAVGVEVVDTRSAAIGQEQVERGKASMVDAEVAGSRIEGSQKEEER